MFNPFWDYTEPEPILRDVFWDENPFSGAGIFAQIAGEWGLVGTEHQGEFPPWYTEVPSDVLNREYFLNHSGGKFCSPLVKYYINKGNTNQNGVLDATATGAIARIIVSKYRNNWTRLWEVNEAAYNPINNYDMTETRVTKSANSESKVGDTQKSDTGSETLTHGLVETVQHGKTTNSMDYKYGINTDTNDPKPSEKGTITDGGTTVTSDTGNDVKTRNLNSGIASTENSVGANEENEEIRRSGNIGVTTTQKMIEEERRLWVWNYFEQVFSDLDKELALSFHDPCRV